MGAGKLYGIGVGPGDSQLLTAKAIRVIQNADVIITPKTEKKNDSVAFQIASPYIKRETEILPIVFPMVSNLELQGQAWQENQEKIAAVLNTGKDAVFLTLGDPMFYSTYMYVYRILDEAGYEIETIPGIPAFLAIASRLGRPVAEQEDVVTVLPATASPDKMEQVIAVSDSLVIMKVYKSWPVVKALLKKYDMLNNAIMISRAGLPDEEVFTDLTAIPDDAKINYLSTILAKRGDL